MCARLAYPNGDAREEETLIKRSGNRMRLVGMIDGTFCPRGVERNRYTKPVIAAKND